MRQSSRISREQHQRREAKAARRRTRHRKGRRSPANERLYRGPARRRENRVRFNPLPPAKQDGFLRRGLSKLNPFKTGRYGAGHRIGGGGGHRG